MLVPLVNEPRDYAWGSHTLIAGLEGREPSAGPEAEVWFGDHPADPALVPDGRPLGAWLAADGAATGAPSKLPYLLKVLAAASPLSIQAHPSKAQAEAGFAREDAAGIPRDAGERTYRDDNHKPELIVALSDTFTALAGLRDLEDTRRLVAGLGAGARPLGERLEGPDAASTLRDAIGWLLSGASGTAIREIIDAAAASSGGEFAAELDLVRHLEDAYPGDPGIVVALLMNLVTLHRGEAVFIPAGVLHAYLEGLGVELMAASDNVLRGGLTSKHIDVSELMVVLDPTPGPAPILSAQPLAGGVEVFAAGIPDFALMHVKVGTDLPIEVPLTGVGIVLATMGRVVVAGVESGESAVLAPGQATLATPDERMLRLSGLGEIFIAVPGATG